MRLVSASLELAWPWAGTDPESLPGRCQLGPTLAPGGSGFAVDPAGPTGESWYRAGQKIASRSGEKDHRAEDGTQMAVRPPLLEPSRGCSPGFLEAPCSRSAQICAASGFHVFGTACHQCHLCSALWAPLPQAPLFPSHPLPCQGEASCNSRLQRAHTMHVFFLFSSCLTGHRAEHMGHLEHAERGHPACMQ